jgi:hypothetical protein
MKILFKRTVAVLMVMAIGVLCPIVSAAENFKQGVGLASEMVLVSEEVAHLNGGLILVTTIHEQVAPSSRSTYTKSGSKTQTVRNSSNVALFSYTVHGVFTVNPGISATCTSSTASHTIHDSAWSLASSTASRSGNRALATGVFNRRLLGIVVETRTLDLTLTCSVNGVLS